MKKITKVELLAVDTGERKPFEAAHAERILGMGARSGFVLPEDSGYAYDKRYGLRLRENKKNSRASGEAGDTE